MLRALHALVKSGKNKEDGVCTVYLIKKTLNSIFLLQISNILDCAQQIPFWHKTH